MKPNKYLSGAAFILYAGIISFGLVILFMTDVFIDATKNKFWLFLLPTIVTTVVLHIAFNRFNKENPSTKGGMNILRLIAMIGFAIFFMWYVMDL